MSRPSRRCPSLERGCFAYAVLAKTDVATTPGIPGYATIGLCQGAGTGTGEEAGGRGRGGRPRPPACPWRPRGRLRVHGAPGTSRPTMCADMARSVVGADVLGRPRVRGVPVGVFAYTARRGRRALPCATREGRACRGRLVGVRLWNADASHTQFWQRPMWLRRPEYRATPQSVFAKVQGREPARRREGVVGADVLGRPPPRP